jgi:hypothetical protein
MLEITDTECRLFKYTAGREFMQLVKRLGHIPVHLTNGSCMQIFSLFSPDLT